MIDPNRRMRIRGALTRPYWRSRFAAFGAGSILYRPDWVVKPGLMAFGSNVWIGPHAWLEISPSAFDRTEPVLRVGDGVVLRQHVTLSAADSVVIEDDVLIAAWTSVYDSDHTLGPRGNAIWYPAVTAPVRIGRGSWLGERVAVLGGADIGAHCVIGANSVVKGSIPDYSVAVGAPARVVGSTRATVDANARP